MTFDEALNQKKIISKKIIHLNKEFISKIVPKNSIDKNKFLTELRLNIDLDDDTSKAYSTNNEYEVIYFYTDGVNVLTKSINF